MNVYIYIYLYMYLYMYITHVCICISLWFSENSCTDLQIVGPPCEFLLRQRGGRQTPAAAGPGARAQRAPRGAAEGDRGLLPNDDILFDNIHIRSTGVSIFSIADINSTTSTVIIVSVLTFTVLFDVL